MRYYYTELSEIICMAKDFGFKFISYHADIFEGDQWFDWKRCEEGHPYHNIIGYYDNLNHNKKIYIHPDSIELLKPQIGDLVTNIGVMAWWINRIENDKLFFAGNEYGNAKEMKILKRNGKAFFTPEEES